MSQSPPENFDSQQPDVNSTQQAGSSMPHNSVQGNQNRDIQGNKNQGVLGDNNTVVQAHNSTQNICITNYYREDIPVAAAKPSTKKNNLPISPFLSSEQVQENPVGEKISEDHKYKGKLATLEIEFYEIIPSRKLSTKLSISFGTIEVNIPNANKILNRTNKTIDIKFGIKNSELSFDLKNGIMPLKERNILINQDYNWKGNPTGTQEYPIWEFKLDNKSENGNQSQILYGFLKNEFLGILELLEADTCCELKAFLQVSVNRNYIAIIDLDDGTNKKNRETKIGLLLQYLKTEIGHYISQVAIKI